VYETKLEKEKEYCRDLELELTESRTLLGVMQNQTWDK